MNKKIHIVIFTAIVISLLGCSTTPNRMRNSAPDMVHSSSKEAKEIAICIAESWEDHGIVNQRESQNGYSVTVSLGGKLHYLADVEKLENICKTKAYKFMSLAPFGDPFFDAVANCQ